MKSPSRFRPGLGDSQRGVLICQGGKATTQLQAEGSGKQSAPEIIPRRFAEVSLRGRHSTPSQFIIYV